MLKSARWFSTKTTPPKVYSKIKQELQKKDLLEKLDTTNDHLEAIKRAQTFSLLDKVETERTSKWGKGLMKRLENDGGKKISVFNKAFLHVEYTRFIKPCGEVKGLSLDDALLQLSWSQNRVSEHIVTALKEFIFKAKNDGFDLTKTYIADAYVKETKAGISTRFLKKYLKGRGRYGSTPHPKVARLQIILQEREKPFAKKLADPLEWIRVRLRERKREYVKSAEDLYDETKSKRPTKIIYN